MADIPDPSVVAPAPAPANTVPAQAKVKANKTPTVPSLLAYCGKLCPSIGLFAAGNWDHRADPNTRWRPMPLAQTKGCGVVANREGMKEKSGAKKQYLDQAQPWTADYVTLPQDCDTLRIRFTLQIVRGPIEPHSCNLDCYRKGLHAFVERFTKEVGFHTLALRYAANIANARFAWRNLDWAGAAEVIVRDLEADSANRAPLRFDAFAYSRLEPEPEAPDAALSSLANWIEHALQNGSRLLLQVDAYLRMGAGQPVFPSQEFIDNNGSGGKKDKPKVLFDVAGADGNTTAALHPQKIGNAIRTIDTWYGDEFGLPPIAVNPFGIVVSQGSISRKPHSEKSFYTLLDKAVGAKGKAGPVWPGPEQANFVMACLLRGGVFGESGKGND